MAYWHESNECVLRPPSIVDELHCEVRIQPSCRSTCLRGAKFNEGAVDETATFKQGEEIGAIAEGRPLPLLDSTLQRNNSIMNVRTEGSQVSKLTGWRRRCRLWRFWFGMME